MSRSVLVLTGLELQNTHVEDGRTLAGEFTQLLHSDEVTVRNLVDVEFWFCDGDVTVSVDGTLITDFNYVILFGGVSRNFRIAYPLAKILDSCGVEFFDQGILSYRGVDKLAQYAELQSAGVKIPNTFFASAAKLASSGEKIGFPFILKDILASQGNHNYLVKSQSQLLKLLNDEERSYVAQEYIPNDGDVRVLINKQREMFAFKRSAVEGTHLNNTSRGGLASPLATTDLPEALRRDCITIVDSHENQIIGIDAIISGSNHCILEVNTQPQIFSGALVERKKEFYRRSINAYVEDKDKK